MTTRGRTWTLAAAGLVALVGVGAILAVQQRQATAAHREACIHNLRKFEAARQRWAEVHPDRAGQPLGLREVNEIIRCIEGGDGFPSRCPDNGTYWIEADGTPTCTWGELRGHRLDGH